MNEMETIKGIEERIAHVRSRISDMYRDIGEAYESGDKAGISYYEMHLKAWQDELAELEVERETKHPTVEELCMDLLRKRCALVIEAQEREYAMKNRRGETPQRIVSAEEHTSKEFETYNACLDFAAELLGVDHGELDREVYERALGA